MFKRRIISPSVLRSFINKINVGSLHENIHLIYLKTVDKNILNSLIIFKMLCHEE